MPEVRWRAGAAPDDGATVRRQLAGRARKAERCREPIPCLDNQSAWTLFQFSRWIVGRWERDVEALECARERPALVGQLGEREGAGGKRSTGHREARRRVGGRSDQ